MLLVILIILLFGLAGFIVSRNMKVRRHPVQVRYSKCLDCGERIPEGFKTCMRCYSCQKTIDK